MSYNNCTILSDLHWEFHSDFGLNFSKFIPENEFLILAGDIACWQNKLRFFYFDAFLELSNKFKQIIYVFGNHEYYKSNFYEAKNNAQCCLEKINNLIILDNQFITLNNTKVLGTTLWYKLPEYGNMKINDDLITDYYEIDFLNKKSISFLEREIEKDSIVITHHLPSWKSIAKEHEYNPNNRFYVTNLLPLIEITEPKYWIHGHTHESCDYIVNNTNVICNPFGYLHEEPEINLNWTIKNITI